MYVTAIIAAGGRGARVGAGMPKQLLEVGGRAILERSVDAFVSHAGVTDIVVALPEDLAAAPPPYLAGGAKPLRVVTGGMRRQDSVAAAFALVPAQTELVIIHDAARPFVTSDLISRTIAAAAECGAALAAIEARDTVKQAANGVVSATLDRRTIFLAQTPQAFRRDVLRDALAITADATDEAALAEQAGHAVRIVAGDASNIKITTPDDLRIAETIARSAEASRSGDPRELAGSDDSEEREGSDGSREREGFSRADSERAKPARTGRTGFGYDLHRLVEGRPLILGGVTIPFEKGLAGHSDADAICHAVTDAILGAAGAGDIGRHFPDTDPKWKGASSVELLRQAVAIVRARGLAVGNVDATVILERPKLAPHVDAMRATLADVLGVTIDRVSIKGKTNEGVGELGRGEAIAVHAVAVVRSA